MEAASGKTILIVEDERDVVDLLTLNLRKAGFAISMANDGAVGLQKARSEKPAFIILDLMLPKMPGLEICKILKSDPTTRRIPIMTLTAKAEEIDRINLPWPPHDAAGSDVSSPCLIFQAVVA